MIAIKMREEDTISEMPPTWFADLNQDDCVRLDVRPVLAAGDDPLERILCQLDQLSAADILLIEAPFDPVPLRRMLAGRGYDNHIISLSPEHWQVYFKQQAVVILPELPDLSDLPAFPYYWHEGQLEMDLRRLEPPNPMIAILKVIEAGNVTDNFRARLIRDPIYLYPELAERGWVAEVLEENDAGLLVKIIQRK